MQYQRTISSILQRYASLFPVVGITGPRQSGKTTLAKKIFSHLPYVSMENLDIRTRVLADPRGFLTNYQHGAIFDEVQNTPALLSYLQQVVDEQSTTGRYVLTGSQNFVLSEQISQSLSGRIGMTTLLPLSLQELNAETDSNQQIFQGGYPRLHYRHINPLDFYPSYIQTYLERDIRQLKQIGNHEVFQNFLKLCAGRVGQLVNFSSLAQDCGISHTTAREWLNVLKASYVVFFLQPFYQNFNKRVIKMPKLYFYDTGLACSLLGLEKAEQVQSHYLRGGLFENLVILEVLKMRFNQGLPANLYFWRDRTGHEIDLLGDWGGKLHAIEIKSGSTFQSAFIKNLAYFSGLAPSNSKTYLIYTGEQTGHVSGVELLPLTALAQRTDCFD